MTFLALPPKTNPVPYPFFDTGSPDQLRGIAFEIEDTLGSHQEASFGRPGLLYIRSALMDLADRIERDGFIT